MPGQPRNRALAAGLGAYVMWGMFPPFFSWLLPATAMEILSHRIVWSFGFVLVALVVLRHGWAWIRTGVFTREAFPRLALAAVLVASNWLVYIWAVNSEHVVEASVGYFINPLVSVLLGVILFKERLGLGGRLGGLIALIGVLVISWGHLSTLWISFALALSFGLYGATKKRAHLGGLQGLLVESGLLVVFAVGYLVWLGATGQGQFGGPNNGLTALLVVSGLVTALPLWLFAFAAPRLPLGVLGVMQYVTPTMQFLFGLLLFGEPVAPSYWVGLAFIWVGSAVYLWLTLQAGRAAAAVQPDL